MLRIHASMTQAMGLTGCFRRRLSLWSVSDAVQEAISSKLPVVALESTIIAHGMPYPQNLEVARQVEHVVRQVTMPSSLTNSCQRA